MSRKRNFGKKRDIHTKNYRHDYFAAPCFDEDNDMIDNISISKSSSSSLSWGEDCEIEATESVKCEYQRMNNILKGLEPIPPHYDKDEYKLWIKTFPCLRIRNSSAIIDEIETPKSLKVKCDILPNNTIKKTVIDDLLNKRSYIMTSSSGKCKVSEKRRNHGDKHTTVIETENNKWKKNNLEGDFHNFLRISPAPTYKKSVNLGTRRRSTTLMSNYNNIEGSANFFNSSTTDYASLPHLPTDNFLNIGSKHLNIPKRRLTNRVNKIVLPPIDVSLNQFRSISAVPLQPFQKNKCSSALSTKTNLNFALGFKNNAEIVGNSNLSGKNKLKVLY